MPARSKMQQNPGFVALLMQSIGSGAENHVLLSWIFFFLGPVEIRARRDDRA